jgi:hypothetical protein
MDKKSYFSLILRGNVANKFDRPVLSIAEISPRSLI